jgi:RHS repeat-associated protein
VWLGDIPVATLRPNGSTVAIFYVHTDQLNTPRQVTRPSDNTPMWTWNSDPFGTDAANPNPTGAGAFAYNVRFPGQIFDGQAGLHYNGYREYDPAVGRYNESDPIGLHAGTNTFAYSLSGPLVGADPLGLLDATSPWQLGWEWVTGTGPRHTNDHSSPEARLRIPTLMTPRQCAFRALRCVLACLFALVGCGSKQISESDLVGAWVPTEESRTFLSPRSLDTGVELVLSPSGDFRSKGIPGELLYSLPGMAHSGPVSGNGTWKIGKVDGEAALLLTFTTIAGPNDFKVPNGTQLLISGNDSRALLYFFMGDPDQGKRVDFHRLH